MATIQPRELRFSTSAEWSRRHEGTLRAPLKGALPIACPPAFCKSPEDLWSPEELLVGAVEACILMTFVYYAERSGLRYSGYRSQAEGLVTMADGTFRFKEIRVETEITVPDPADRDLALKLIHKAEKICLVSRSLLTSVEVVPTVHVGEESDEAQEKADGTSS